VANAGDRQQIEQMRPLSPAQKRLFILIAVLALGAISGLLLGFVISFHGLENTTSVAAGRWFQIWILRPSWYWPWPLFGAAIAGLSLLAADLTRS